MSSVLSSDPSSPRGWNSFSAKEEVRKRSPSLKKPRGFKVIATAMGFKATKSSLLLEGQDPQTIPCISSSVENAKLVLKRFGADRVDPSFPFVRDLPYDKEHGKPALVNELDVSEFRNLSDLTIHSQSTEFPSDHDVSYGFSNIFANSRHEFTPCSPDIGSEKVISRELSGNLHSNGSNTRRIVRINNLAGPSKSLKGSPQVQSSGRNCSSRPACRSWPRRMTESEANRLPSVLGDTALKKSIHRDVVNQFSILRAGSPPYAPPKQKLPPAPTRSDENIVELRKATPSLTTPSNSSFLSSTSPYIELPLQEASSNAVESKSLRLAKCEEIIRHMSPDSPQPLKKAFSQQSLRKHSQSSSGPNLNTPAELKSRHGFRRSEISVRDNSNVSPESNQATGSSAFKPWILHSSLTPPTSGSPPLNLRAFEVSSTKVNAVNEYTPQQILSPEEMAQLEASVEEHDNQVQRQLSFASLNMSGRTFADNPNDVGDNHRCKVQDIRECFGTVSGKCGTSIEAYLLHPKISSRPSTSPSVQRTYAPDLSISSGRLFPVTSSLPPPPRQPLSQPMFFNSSEDNDEGVISLPPPPRTHNGLNHQIILVMRKPSFLDIDDDSEGDLDVPLENEIEDDSFLDLAREPLENTRTEN